MALVHSRMARVFFGLCFFFFSSSSFFFSSSSFFFFSSSSSSSSSFVHLDPPIPPPLAVFLQGLKQEPYGALQQMRIHLNPSLNHHFDAFADVARDKCLAAGLEEILAACVK